MSVQIRRSFGYQMLTLHLFPTYLTETLENVKLTQELPCSSLKKNKNLSTFCIL